MFHLLHTSQYNGAYPQARDVTIQWTGLLDWNTGLDYWTDIFLVFAHSMVGFLLVRTLWAPVAHF